MTSTQVWEVEVGCGVAHAQPNTAMSDLGKGVPPLRLEYQFDRLWEEKLDQAFECPVPDKTRLTD